MRHEFIVMPNHIHGIIEINQKIKEIPKENISKFKSLSQTIDSIIRGYKIATIKKIKENIRSTGVLQYAQKENSS